MFCWLYFNFRLLQKHLFERNLHSAMGAYRVYSFSGVGVTANKLDLSSR